jgi:hypothetical protein
MTGCLDRMRSKWIKFFFTQKELTMSELKQIREKYLKAKFNHKIALSITRLDKLTERWESVN